MKTRSETHVENAFTVESIITFYYVTLDKNKKSGKDIAYDFWQLIYIDDGVYSCVLDGARHTLYKGQLIFCEPGKVRKSLLTSPCTLGIVSFRCDSDKMNSIKNTVIDLTDENFPLLSSILSNGIKNFKIIPSGEPLLGQKPIEGTQSYELQTIKNYLELLLINIYKSRDIARSSSIFAQNKANYYNEQFEKAAQYLRLNIEKNITVTNLARQMGFSVGTLKRIFSRCAGCGAIHYFNTLKIEEAKKLIRTSDMTFTQISDLLGFSGLHYFSRVFKNITGMSPSKYAKSVLK